MADIWYHRTPDGSSIMHLFFGASILECLHRVAISLGSGFQKKLLQQENLRIREELLQWRSVFLQLIESFSGKSVAMMRGCLGGEGRTWNYPFVFGDVEGVWKYILAVMSDISSDLSTRTTYHMTWQRC